MEAIKKNILIVHNYYKIPGGEDTVVANEVSLLNEYGHNTKLYIRNNKELDNFSFLRILLLPFQSIFSLKTFKEIREIIKENNIDIVHVHNTLSLISPSVYYAAFSCKIPVVQTIHNFRMQCPSATFYRNNEICEDCLRKGLISAIKYRCYRNSLMQTIVSVFILKIHRLLKTYYKLNYICLTEFNKEKLLELNNYGKIIINENRVFVKPNFTNIKQTVSLNSIKRNQFAYIGRLDKIKGLKMLFEAWKEIGNYELLICGTGPLEEWCRKYIEINGITNIKLCGQINQKEVVKVILESKAIIYPTQWYEGYPMTIAESFSHGTPVIGSDIGNVGAIIFDGINGLKYKHRSVDDLRLKILKFDSYKFDESIIKSTASSRDVNYSILMTIYDKVLLN